MIFREVSCCNCGIVFGIEKEYDDLLRKEHKTFHCPNGHAQHYTGETEEQRLKKELCNAEARLFKCKEHNRKLDYSRRYYKGRLEKVKR